MRGEERERSGQGKGRIVIRARNYHVCLPPSLPPFFFLLYLVIYQMMTLFLDSLYFWDDEHPHTLTSVLSL